MTAKALAPVEVELVKQTFPELKGASMTDVQVQESNLTKATVFRAIINSP